jgi:RNA-directed DNA polymerase
METLPTLRGGTMATTGVEQIAERASREPTTVFTALMHYFSLENLQACFERLDGTKALGVDKVRTYARDI